MTIRTTTRPSARRGPLRRTSRAVLAGVTGGAALVLLAACGSDRVDSGPHAGHGTSTAPSAAAGATGHNAQDVGFAQGMIPHHQQALEMARLADGRASSAQVKDLAARIEKAQDPEIGAMTGWLKAWGEKVPAAGTDHTGMSGMNGMDDGDESMAGMMSAGDMAALKASSGREFDTKFLSLMVQHHQGAVEMATTERNKGRYAPAKTMADGIVSAQNAEIKEMKQLLGTS